MFGFLEVRQGTKIVNTLRTSRAGALLGYLCLYTGERSRDEVAKALWANKPGDLPNKLSVTLYQLRKELMENDIDPDRILIQSRDTLSIRKDEVHCDWDEFNRLTSQSVGQNSPEATEQRQRLIALYEGDLLLGMNEAWVMPRRSQAVGDFLEAVFVLMNQSLTQNDLAEAWQLIDSALAKTAHYDEAAALVIRYLLAGNKFDQALYVAREIRSTYEKPSQSLLHTLTSAEALASSDPTSWQTSTLLITDRAKLPNISPHFASPLVQRFENMTWAELPNPLLGIQLAKMVLQHHPRARILLHTQVYKSGEPLAEELKTQLMAADRGTILLSAPARSVYEASRSLVKRAPISNQAVVEMVEEKAMKRD
jgi:DNA-binding SARP family transcriptional activator